MNSDGSIIIDTKINTDGIANGERRLQKEFERVADSAEKTGEKIKSSFERTSSFGYDPGAMEAVFGSAAADIRNYSDAVKRLRKLRWYGFKPNGSGWRKGSRSAGKMLHKRESRWQKV